MNKRGKGVKGEGFIQNSKLKIQNLLSRHPDRNLRVAWTFAQLGIFTLPIIPSAGSVALVIVALGIWKQHYRKIVSRPLNWGFAILSVWLVITACFAFNRQDAFLGLANFLPFFLVFAAWSVLFQTPVQLRQMAWLLVVPSVVVVTLGLGQLFLGWAGSQLYSIFGWAIEPNGNPVGRMASVFMHANILAAYLIIVFALGLGLWLETYQELLFKTPLLQANSLQIRLGFLSVTLLGCLVSLILTNSRNAWAIALLICFVFGLYQGWRWLVAVVIGVASSVLCAAFGPSPMQQIFRIFVPPFFWVRLTDQMYPNRPQVELRTTQWQFVWSMTQQRPWMGWGLRNFPQLYQAKMNIALNHPHNLFLMLTFETGIPATILFCSLVGWIMAQGILLLLRCPYNWRQDRLIIFSYLVAFCACTSFNLVDVTLFDFRVNILAWLLLSAICGVGYARRTSQYSI